MKIKGDTNMKEVAKRVIFDNSNTGELYDGARSHLIEEGNDDLTDKQVWDEVYFTLQTWWDDVEYEMKKIFDGKRKFLAVGTCGTWRGTFKGGFMFDNFKRLINNVLEDCDYYRIWDENGHLFVQGWHNDGTNIVEIKELTDRGYNKLCKWEYDYSDHTSEEEIHRKLFTDSHYSKLIHYSHKVYGCPKVEYEKKVG